MKTFIEHEIAYEWLQKPVILRSLNALRGWKSSSKIYTLTDSIYDTADGKLGELSTGVRVRSSDDVTVLTAKRFVRRDKNGVGVFEEVDHTLNNGMHPEQILSKDLGITLPELALDKQLTFVNTRTEIEFSLGDSRIRIINEDVTYSNSIAAHSDALIEIEFEQVANGLVSKVKKEFEQDFSLRVITEGKIDRARRFLGLDKPIVNIQNLSEVAPVKMSAHGGEGMIEMHFFHTLFSRFDEADDIKAPDYKKSNWEFFAFAELPVGAEVKEHLHDKTDEFYFILDGSATVTVDGVARIVKKNDCILTRQGSRHSITKVRKQLTFLATEILAKK